MLAINLDSARNWRPPVVATTFSRQLVLSRGQLNNVKATHSNFRRALF
jgi:hypothetical protein